MLETFVERLSVTRGRAIWQRNGWQVGERLRAGARMDRHIRKAEAVKTCLVYPLVREFLRRARAFRDEGRAGRAPAPGRACFGKRRFPRMLCPRVLLLKTVPHLLRCRSKSRRMAWRQLFFSAKRSNAKGKGKNKGHVCMRGQGLPWCRAR